MDRTTPKSAPGRSSRSRLLSVAKGIMSPKRSKSPGKFQNLYLDRSDQSNRSAPDILDSMGSLPLDEGGDIPTSTKGKSKRKSGRRAASLTDDVSTSSLSESPHTPSAPNTPKAREKIRRTTLTEKLRRTDLIRDAVSVPDTDAGVVTPTKKGKKARRNSFGAVDTSKQRGLGTRSGSLSPIERESRKERKRPGKRSGSLGALEGRNRVGKRSTSTGEDLDILSHLDTEKQKEKISRDNDLVRSPRTGKLRTTVNADGKISRINKKSDDGAESDRSVKSLRSKGTLTEKRKKRPGTRRPPEIDESILKKHSSVDLDTSGHSKRSTRSNHSRRSTRTSRSERPSKSTEEIDESIFKKHSSVDLDTSGHSKRSTRSNHSRRSTRTSRSERPFRSTDFEESYSSIFSDPSMLIGNSLLDINMVKNAEVDEEVEKLQSKIMELKEGQITAQTDAAKLRKELREGKLQVQKSQTELRELQLELRERESTIEDSNHRIVALEKAVESQLDKIEELEEELRRANEEIFNLEDKLSHMEEVLVDSEAAKNIGAGMERAFDEKRKERFERRLDEKEKELEEREKQLQVDRNKILSVSQRGSGRGNDSDRIEQDNKMLLKALNREKEDAAETITEKDLEIEHLKKELKAAKQSVYSAFSGDEATASLMKQNEKKDDTIAFMEIEIMRLKKELDSKDLGDYSRVKRDLEASKAEAQVMKSKHDGAQRRNRILEDDIHHWKSVNIDLEEEMLEWKAQVASWKSKYEGVVGVDSNEDEPSSPEANMLPFQMNRHSVSAAEMAMGPRYDSDDEHREEESGNAISNLWAKITTPVSNKGSISPHSLRSRSIRDQIQRATFH